MVEMIGDAVSSRGIGAANGRVQVKVIRYSSNLVDDASAVEYAETPHCNATPPPGIKFPYITVAIQLSFSLGHSLHTPRLHIPITCSYPLS